MKNVLHSLFLFSIIFLCLGLSSQSYCGDPVGKIFSKAEANQKFGPVVKSVTLSVKEVRAMIALSKEFVLFNINENGLRALGDKRLPLNAAAANTKATEVFHKYSKSKVDELLSLGDGTSVTFEQRADVFSVTSGDYTLEMSLLCPPYCNI